MPRSKENSCKDLGKLLNRPQGSRMFNFVSRTWNPVIGCKHLCTYCWARKLAERLKNKTKKYSSGFNPKIVRYELEKKFKEGEVVFVSDMGDLFGEWVPREWISEVLDTIRRNPGTCFFLLTKNPRRYLELLDEIPGNCILGATIETNRDLSGISRAPSPMERLDAMKKLRSKWKGYLMISIEPVIDFDSSFPREIIDVKPDFVIIGKDNYNSGIPEPSREKLVKLIRVLKSSKVKVVLKNSLRTEIRMPKKRPNINKLLERLKYLTWGEDNALLQKLAEVGDNKFNEFKEWSLLKLICLDYFLCPYLRIVGKLKEEESRGMRLFYIDPFAGTGLNRVPNEDVIFAGSPLVAIHGTKRMLEKYKMRKFDEMIFCDLKYGDILEKRINYLSRAEDFSWVKDTVKIYKGDANEIIYEISDEIEQEKMKNYLAFVDPYKWEISWDSLERLLEIKYGDLMITHQARLIAKEIGRIDSLKNAQETVSGYFGESLEKIRELNSEEAVKDFYISKIKKFKKFVLDIKINGKGFCYYLIFASREKRPKWSDIVYRMKEMIENYDRDLVKIALDRLLGRQSSLQEFKEERNRRLTEF